MRTRLARQHVALAGTMVAGLAVAGAVLGTLARLPEPPDAPPAVHVAGPPAPLTGSGPSPTPTPDATTTVRALAASTPAVALTGIPPTPPPAAPPASEVRLTAPTDAVTIRSGEQLVIDLAGTAAGPWNAPTDPNPGVLRPVGVDAQPLALHAVYVGVRPGTAILELDRLSVCSEAASVGICPAQAYRVTVTVTGG
jgi:hypothetical protein